MTEKPHSLPGIPPDAADVLSDLLRRMRLNGTVLFQAEFREPWSIVTPGCEDLASLMGFRAQHIIPFHVIETGGCWLRLGDREPIWLEAGDVVVFPGGDRHGLHGRVASATAPMADLLPATPWSRPPEISHGGQGPATEVVCGFLACDEWLFQPMVPQLPSLLHVRPGPASVDRWLAATIEHMTQEVRQPSPGSLAMLPRLAELLFVEILRKQIRSLPENEVGWLAACKDPVVGAALKLIHAEPLRGWTLHLLARDVGVSRTVLGERFKSVLGLPPMQYLARWRLQLAAQEAKTSGLPIKALADAAGYASEAAFSRAFKRLYGQPPLEWLKLGQL